jgi:hypothetical protein
MDNCNSGHAAEIFMLLGENHLKIGIFALHTTNIFQTPEMFLFAVLKTK